MSHHYSGPDFGFPHGDARLDLTDLYAFPKPGNPNKSIFIMNVHPSVGVNPPETTIKEPFSSEAVYELRIDTDGDAIADITYRVRFTASESGEQTGSLYRIEGPDTAPAADDGVMILNGAPVSTDRTAQLTNAREYQFFAGWRSDPYFFDTKGALNNLSFTGEDFFAVADVCSIVLEVPNSALEGREVGIWHRTLDGRDGTWVQADRGARPSQAVFLSGDEKARYLASEPAGDARFVPVFAHSLEHTGGYSPAEAMRTARALLPDILRYDPYRPASYPTSGRTLTDSVMEHFLPILTNGRIHTDGVQPHQDLLGEFPYLGPPHSR